MRELYPEIEPYKIHQLSVSKIHTLYIEEAGNPSGEPVVFLHGGPGGGLSPKHRRYFNPSRYRVILIDQRGAGKSTPYAELEENTTWNLVQDIETVRNFLHIDKWVVFGGSWGSTLSLCYAIRHADVVTRLILRGIFLCRKEEINWFYQQGASFIFPDKFQDYISVIPQEERGDLLSAFYKRLTSDDPETRLQAAKAWSLWEGSALRLIPEQETMDTFEEIAISLARIECHYFVNNCFFPTDNYILENVGNISHLPVTIVHGRYDVVCPVKNAFDLHHQLPKSTLEVIADAGHAADEPGITDALIRATDQ